MLRLGWFLHRELANLESSGVSKLPSYLLNPEDVNPLTLRSIRVQPGATCSDKLVIYGFYRLFDPTYGD